MTLHDNSSFDLLGFVIDVVQPLPTKIDVRSYLETPPTHFYSPN